jgi:PAS domain S-box-containing protein
MSVSYIGVASLAIAAFGTALLSAHVWRRRHITSGRPFALCMAAVTWWALASFATYLSPTLEGKLVWTNLQYIGIVLVPPTWLLFALAYAGRGSLITPVMRVLLCVHPALVQVALWTDAYHKLFRTEIWLDNRPPITTMGVNHGPFFWAHTVYAYLLLLIGFYYLFRVRRDAPRVYQRQTFALLVALAVPWGANMVTIADPGPLSYIDLTPFAFALSGLAVTWGLLRHGLFDLVPVAHSVVISHLVNGVIVMDQRGRVVNLNPAAAALLGCAPEAAVGQRLAHLLPAHADLLDRCQEEETVHAEVLFGEGDAQVALDLSITGLRDNRDSLIGHLVDLQDITERVRSQAALRHYADRLRVLHEIDHAILAAQSPETIANAALEQIHHLVPSQRMSVLVLDAQDRVRLLALRATPPLMGNGTTWQELLETGDLRLHDIFSVDTLSGSEDAPPFERRLYSEGVRACLVIPLISQEVIVGALNLESAFEGVFNAEHADIAAQVATSLAVALENARLYAAAQQELKERKAVEAALRESETTLREKAEDLAQRNAELDAFAHTVAHDLKMPLSLLIGYTSFIEAGEVADDPAQLDWCVQAIGQSARKMSSIIDELLLLASFRKIGDVKLKPLDMGAIVSDVVIRFTDLIEQRKVDIQMPKAWPIAWGYAPWIEEVWANYLSNAIKYGGTPPRIEIGATVLPASEDDPRPSSTVVRFWVRDNGQGLSPEQQARLFVPFERLDQARAKGHGLGLSIVNRIVEKLGGTSGVESEVGKGSTFYFTLPQADLPN